MTSEIPARGPEPLHHPPEPWRGLDRERYEAMVDSGGLAGAPVELLGGVLVERTAQGPERDLVVQVLVRHLARSLPEPWSLRGRMPLAADDRSVLEPDVAVVRDPTPDTTPTTAALVVEVVTGRRHPAVRARVYGAAGVTAYWVVDVPRREVVVHTGPRDDGYTSVVRQPWSQPLSVPVGDGVPVDLAALLD